MLAPIVALVVLLVAAALMLAAAALLWRDTREERAIARSDVDVLRAEISDERDLMGAERKAWADERMQLVARLMFATGKPYEQPPIWARSDAPRREQDGPLDGVDRDRYVFPDQMLQVPDVPELPVSAEPVELVGVGANRVWEG